METRLKTQQNLRLKFIRLFPAWQITETQPALLLHPARHSQLSLDLESKLAPPKRRKIASYLVGECSFWLGIAIQSHYVSGAGNIGAGTIQGFAVVALDSYVPNTWHIVVLTILICSFAILFNVFLARKLPGIEAVVFITYALGFIAFFIVLLFIGSRSTAKEIFTPFEDNASWSSIGTACLVGMSGPHTSSPL